MTCSKWLTCAFRRWVQNLAMLPVESILITYIILKLMSYKASGKDLTVNLDCYHLSVVRYTATMLSGMWFWTQYLRLPIILTWIRFIPCLKLWPSVWQAWKATFYKSLILTEYHTIVEAQSYLNLKVPPQWKKPLKWIHNWIHIITQLLKLKIRNKVVDFLKLLIIP